MTFLCLRVVDIFNNLSPLCKLVSLDAKVVSSTLWERCLSPVGIACLDQLPPPHHKDHGQLRFKHLVRDHCPFACPLFFRTWMPRIWMMTGILSSRNLLDLEWQRCCGILNGCSWFKCFSAHCSVLLGSCPLSCSKPLMLEASTTKPYAFATSYAKHSH